MNHGVWPRPSLRRRISSILLLILVAMGYRRCLFRPRQILLRDYLVVVATCAAVLLLSRYSTPIIVLLVLLAAMLVACPILASRGFKLTEIAVLLAIFLLTAAFLLPTIQRTRVRTLGKRSFPFAIPATYLRLFSNPS